MRPEPQIPSFDDSKLDAAGDLLDTSTCLHDDEDLVKGSAFENITKFNRRAVDQDEPPPRIQVLDQDTNNCFIKGPRISARGASTKLTPFTLSKETVEQSDM